MLCLVGVRVELGADCGDRAPSPAQVLEGDPVWAGLGGPCPVHPLQETMAAAAAGRELQELSPGTGSWVGVRAVPMPCSGVSLLPCSPPSRKA